MNEVYPLVPLSDVLTERQEVPSADALIKGEICVIEKIGFNDGKIQLRTNSTTKTNMILIQPGDLVVSGINAAKGAIAIFDQKNTRPIAATIHYSSYIINKQKADIKYLWWLLRSHKFKELLLEYSPGGIKTELKAKRFLPIPIPLPPLEEQRRIVVRVEELVGKIEEVRSLRQKALEETEALVISLHLSLANSKTVTLDEILILEEQQEKILFGKQYPQVGVKGFGGGLFAKGAIDATQTTYKVFNHLYQGALVLSQVKGWEGAIGVCPSNLAGKYVSPEYRTFRCIPGKAIPEYLSVLVTTNWFWTKLKDLTRGMGGRRERTRPEQFLKMEIPMPTVEQQKKVIPIFEKIHKMKPLREEAIKELDAILPSILDKAFKGEL